MIGTFIDGELLQFSPHLGSLMRCHYTKPLLPVVKQHVIALDIRDKEETLLFRLADARGLDDVIVSTSAVLRADDRDSVWD